MSNSESRYDSFHRLNTQVFNAHCMHMVCSVLEIKTVPLAMLQTVNAVSSSGVSVVTLKDIFFLGLDLTVTEINIKKYR